MFEVLTTPAHEFRVEPKKQSHTKMITCWHKKFPREAEKALHHLKSFTHVEAAWPDGDRFEHWLVDR
ncbi:hypothetical protein CEXT_738791 [Caerostris extrusa]|uniref:Uncharacterized protein n=1 Tax=Caerostris extrusa TaxID=172846 RepID=A0AAV4QJW4_CAEEX|nr:hypothetical protein CEXT_738791 [Caerostris extrusa]